MLRLVIINNNYPIYVLCINIYIFLYTVGKKKTAICQR